MTTHTKFKFKHTLVAFCIGVGLAAAMPVKAFGGEALVVAAITALQGAMQGIIQRMASGVMDQVIKGAKDSVSSVIKGNSDVASIIAQGNRISQQVASEASARVQEAIFRAQHNTNLLNTEKRFQETNPCSVSAPAGGLREALEVATNPTMAGAAAQGRGGSGGVPRRAFAGGSGALNKVLNTAENRPGTPNGDASKPAPEVVATLAAEGACAGFVAPGTPRAAICRAANLQASNETGLADADVSAATLTSGPRRANAPATLSYNLDDSGSEHKALAAYKRNLYATFEQRDLTPAEARTDAGKRFISMRDAYNARMSMAEMPASMQIAGMKASAATIPALKALMSQRGDPGFLSPYLARAKPDWERRGVSPDELLNIEVQRRYMNQDWLDRTVTMAPDPRAAETLRVQALTNVLLWDLRREVRMNNLLIGAQMANGIRNETMPELKLALSQAAR